MYFRPTRPRSPDPEQEAQELEQRKHRWRTRRLVLGGTGCSSSAIDRLHPRVRRLCRQRGVPPDAVLRYLRLNEGI